MPERLTKRNGAWHFVRRVPPEYAKVDPRGTVFISTKVRVKDDRAGVKASRVAEKLNLDLEAFGQATQATLNLDDARRRAQALGLDYKPMDAALGEAAAELMRRVEALAQGDRRHDPATTAAVLGGVPLPEILLSGLFAEYKGAKRTSVAKMSPGQVKKWKNGKTRAIELMIEVVGDKAIGKLTRDDALKFTDHWEKRVVDGEVEAGTANRNLTHLKGMLSAVSKRYRLNLDPVFAGARLEGDRARPRPPFTAAFIVNRILAPGALDRMNEEERAAVLVLVNTGARPSEIINLRRERIILDAEIPHIQVRPDDRVLKTEWSFRDIPLVGIGLEAMRAFPDGFPRYKDRGDAFSAAVNKYLDTHGMKESDRHTLYSLRHGFKDRLREVGTPTELMDELMGHDPKKPQYGDGYGLKLKLKFVSAIELAPGMQLAPPLELVRAQVTLRSADRILVALELGELVLKPIQPRGILRTMLDDHFGDQSDGADQPLLCEVSAGLHDLAFVGLTRKMRLPSRLARPLAIRRSATASLITLVPNRQPPRGRRSKGLILSRRRKTGS